jgi:hypothetical protein
MPTPNISKLPATKRSGAIVIFMQRLHEDDLVGHVLAQDQVDSTVQFLDWFKKPFPGRTFTSSTASMPKQPSSAASHNRPKPYRSPALWSGSPNRTNTNEPPLRRRLSGKHNFNWLW